jgi:hypothetical protein
MHLIVIMNKITVFWKMDLMISENVNICNIHNTWNYVL